MTTIILNPEAVNALFPEGSEARVELQRSVLSQLAKQYIKQPDLTAEIFKQIDNARKGVVDEALKTLGIVKNNGYLTVYRLEEQAASLIRTEARTSVINEVFAGVKLFIEKSSMNERINHVVEERVNIQVKAAVAKAITDSLSGLGTLAALMGQKA